MENHIVKTDYLAKLCERHLVYTDARKSMQQSAHTELGKAQSVPAYLQNEDNEEQIGQETVPVKLQPSAVRFSFDLLSIYDCQANKGDDRECA